VAALLAVFVGAGVAAFRRLPVEAYPDVTNVSFQIITLFPGHAAEEVERLVTIQNGVILIERIRELRRSGLDMVAAVTEGAVSRVRPVVMTGLMASLGLLPAGLSTAVGAETARPFAVVIIGGLITATLLTLFLLPILYPLFESEETNGKS
jgi:Cu/Ag efflux pump CusA